MRWKLMRRRWSISAPRMIVRRHLPWPLRWAVIALTLGFSAAIALWAFEFGRTIAGLDRGAQAELVRLRAEVDRLHEEREGAQSIANTADSLLKAERAAQRELAQQLKQAEAENQRLKGDLAFFERLLPASSADGLSIRAFRVDEASKGHLRYQALIMSIGRASGEFAGRYELTLSGSKEGRPWSAVAPGGARSLKLTQSLRLEGEIETPAGAVIKQVLLTVTDARGVVRASQSVKL
jgi:hypothetical protein